MDQVFIEGLRVETVIGVYDWEKRIRQTLVFDLWLGTDIRPAAGNDDIAQTLDYAQICEQVTEFVSSSRFELVETVAERVAQLILDNHPCPWIRLKVSKPGAVATATNVGVMIERSAD